MKVIKRELLYKGRIFNLVRDRIRAEDEHEFVREYLDYEASVCMIPVEHEYVYFVYQYRHPVGKWILELPAGKVEKNEDPYKTAIRELQEEIGFKPEKMELIAKFYTVPGYSKEYMYLYLAQGLEPSSLPKDRDEHIKVVKLPIEEAIKKAVSGELEDAKTIIGLLYLHILRSDK